MPLPEHYDDFDPVAHDDEMARLDVLLLQHWNEDLRNLQSEADAAREEDARRKSSSPIRYKQWREEFEAAHPRPTIDDDPAEAAEWEWRWLDYFYTQAGDEDALNRHHLGRGAFIERHTRYQRNSAEYVLGFRDRLRGVPDAMRRYVPQPWPEGDGVTELRERFDAEMEPEKRAEEMAARQEPSYARAADLEAALMGWLFSLPLEAHDFAEPFRGTADRATRKAAPAYRPDYAPGNIGTYLLHMRQALEHTQDALDLLGDLRDEWWMTPAAHTRLTTLLQDLRAAALDRYVALRTIYDGYLERAERILGGTKWSLPSE